jgi:membrane-bound lytic murein transglycosylase D
LPITLVRYTPSPRKVIRKLTYQPLHNYIQKVGYYNYRRGNNTQATWSQVHSGFKFSNYNHKYRVRKYVKAYARMPARMSELSHRSSKYLPTIIAEVKRRKMPTEIALLPFVESAFNDRAYSPAKAAGLWQFIPATARRYGLSVSSRYDARYNWKASTKAALSYLQDLNREFNGDWLLSLAAYNCGEARVQREIAKNRARGLPTDFWNLKLPKETRNYVPRLLAFKEIYSKPNQYGVNLSYVSNKRMVTSQTVKKNGHRRQGHSVITHRVKMGDTLYQIAKKYNTSVYSIMRMNGLKSTNIKLGKHLKIASRNSRQYG